MTNTPSPDEDRELIERLRAYRVFDEWGDQKHPITDEAADRLESLLSDRAKLEEALREVRGWVWGEDRRRRIDTALNRSTDRAT